MTSPDQSRDRFRPTAAIAAMVLPGLGHVVLGHTRRGALVAVGVLGLVASGLFIGGISVVDRRESPVWFVAQALSGPIAFGVDYVHQHRFKVRDAANFPFRTALPSEGRAPDGTAIANAFDPPYVKSLGRVNEIGILYVAIAGMLNLIAVIDAAFNTPACGRAGRDESMVGDGSPTPGGSL